MDSRRPYGVRCLSGGLLVALLTLAGCASGLRLQVTRLDQTTRPNTNLVQVFHSKPSKPYEVIARIKGEGPEGTSPAQLISAIQQKAATLGGDAIILHDQSSKVSSQVTFNPAGGQYQLTPSQTVPRYSADVIHWTSSSDQSTN